jgi:hypothetical protein
MTEGKDFNEYGERANPDFVDDKGRLRFQYDSETVLIEPWGHNAFRVRATTEAALPSEEWALTEAHEPSPDVKIEIASGNESAEIVNGRIRATVSRRGKIMSEYPQEATRASRPRHNAPRYAPRVT